MQTKKMFPLILSLFITTAIIAQRPLYTTTINDNRMPESNSFQVNIAAGKSATSFSLWIQNPDKKKLQLEIKHRHFGTLIDTVISNEEFSQRYNMEQADDGNYIITVSCGKEKVVKEIELNTVTTRIVKLN